MTNLLGESSYAKSAVKYIEILNKLRRMGAQSTVDLPTVVFCGNQSAGKSSLLEAISGIQVKTFFKGNFLCRIIFCF